MHSCEDLFQAPFQIAFETSGLACWYPGASLGNPCLKAGLHTDNNREYLNKRDLSCVIWLNPPECPFEGGNFFLEQLGGGQEEIVPECGLGALFISAKTPHGVRAVTRGLRTSLLAWLTYDLSVDEDARVLASLQPLSSFSDAERLFGIGPNSEATLSHNHLLQLVEPLGLSLTESHLHAPTGSHAMELSNIRHFLVLCYWAAFIGNCSLESAGRETFELLRLFSLTSELTISALFETNSQLSEHKKRHVMPRLYLTGSLQALFCEYAPLAKQNPSQG